MRRDTRPSAIAFNVLDQMIIRVNEVTANSFTNFTEPRRSNELVKELAVTPLNAYGAFKNFKSAA